jgi:hypothetical protein
MLRWRVRSRRRPPERHGLGATEQHGVMRVQAKWTQRIDHCASDILTTFRRNFADFSDRLQDSRPRKEQTVDRPSPYRTRALFAPTTLCVGLEPRANSTLMSGSSVNYGHWGGSEHKHG